MRIEEPDPSSSAEMPPASAALLKKVMATKSDAEFIEAIGKGREVHAVMGKTELVRWADVLNKCDEILEKAIVKNHHGNMICDCDTILKKQVITIIRFTVLLFECTSSRRVYKSVDRILSLLESTNMDLLAEVLRLLQVMGKRSKFLSTRIPQKDQQALAHRLTAIAQCWGGKLRSIKMADCLKRDPKIPALFPFTYTDSKQRNVLVEPPGMYETIGEIITRSVAQLSPPVSSDAVAIQPFSKEDTYCLLSRLRFLVRFDTWEQRFKCLIVRLLSVSTLIYCRLGGTDENTISSLLYSGFVDEVADLLKVEREAEHDREHSLYDAIQTEALSTLCSIVTYEKEPKITQILEALAASSYHGFLSIMTRQIVDELKNNNLGRPGKPSVSLATSLFSFIYHLASIEPGGETLVGSGLTQTLLSVIGFHELPIDCITFGTRCARIIDLFTTIDVAAFKANNGMEICVNRVVHEINECRKEQPFMIDVSHDMPFTDEPERERRRRRRRDEDEPMEDDDDDENDIEAALARGILREHHYAGMPLRLPTGRYIVNPEDLIGTIDDPDVRRRPPVAAEPVAEPAAEEQAASSSEPAGEPAPAPDAAAEEPAAEQEPEAAPPAPEYKGGPWEPNRHNGTSCHQQRSGLIKGLLTFIKRAIGDAQFQDVMRHLMEGELPEALMHILSNAEYYSPSLFHQSANLITNFVYQFPEELSSLQKRHVPYVIFQSLLRKELPNSKDVITTLGNVFTAMCLNERGLRQFKAYNPFSQIFRIVLSVKFLVTLRKKRSSEAFESAQTIGSALDDLMRHYPDLKHDMLKSVITILDDLDSIGRSPPEGVELVPTLTKAMARSVVLTSNSSLLPREAHEAHEAAEPAAAPEPEQADERVGGELGDAEPMEVEDGEDSDGDDENEMSMDEMSAEAPEGAPVNQAPSKNEYSAGMMCEDGNGKKILPIGDYMLLIARVVETMMTQSPSQRITDEFVQGDVMQKIMKLCHLPCITNESTHSTYVTSIANIIKHIVKVGFTGQRNGPEAGPKLMTAIVGEFIKTINPLFEASTGDFSALKPVESKKATILMHLDEKLVEKTLVELNSIVPILLNLNKQMPTSYAPQDQRNRLFETWKMPDGVKLYGMLRKLSRMLCWEHELVQTLKPTIRTASTQTEGDINDTPNDVHLDDEIMPPWEEEADEAEKRRREESKEPRWQAAGVTLEEHDFWLKNKPLQDIVSKSHHLVKELLNSLGKQINLPSLRRPRTREQAQLPLAATQCISMIFSSIYKDLKWEPPGAVNSPMAYGRYIELLTQLNHSLFETSNVHGRCGNPALAQNFYTSGCHKAFFELFSEKIIPFLGDDMPEGVEKTMEEWCRLAVKLTDRNSIVSSEQPMPRRDRFATDFDTNKYLKLVCRDMFNVYKQFFEKMAQMPDWELKSLKKVCENAFSVFKEVAKNLVEETEAAAANAADVPPEGWTPGVPAAALGNNDVAPADPLEDQVRMLMDLGFSRDVVMFAMDNSRTADEAANYLLAHGHEVRMREAINNFRNDEPIHLALAQQAPAPIVPGPNIEEIEIQLNAQLVDYTGYELVSAAQRVLIDAGLDHLCDLLAEQIPNDGVEVTPERVINETMEMVKNPRSDYEENIATPLIPPLSQLKIDQDVSLNSACKQLFPLVNRLLLVSNDTIHPCAELVTSIFPAMTTEWRKEHLIAKIIGVELMGMAKKLIEQEVDEKGAPVRHDIARTMANRLHFAVLIFDKVSEEYVHWISRKGMIPTMLDALDYLVKRFGAIEYYQSLITRFICWFDLYAKVRKLIIRRKYLQSLTTTLEWSWQHVEDDALRRRADFTATVEKKWTPYDAAAQKTLNEAFFAGERWTKVMVKRGARPQKRFDVDFLTMKHHEGSTHETIRADLPANVEIKMEDLMKSEAELFWSEQQNDRLLELATEVVKTGALDPKCSYTVLSFLARITTFSRNAVKFLTHEGVEAMLKLKARCAPTYPFLVSVIVRNCIDDEALTQFVFDKTFRSYISMSTASAVTDYQPRKAKDFADTIQVFGSLSNRNPLAFTEAVNKFAKIQGNDIMPIAKEKKLLIPIPTSQQSTSSAAAASSSSATASESTSSHKPIENNWRAVNVVNMMLKEVLDGDFTANGRMLSQEKLILLLAEIVKSYPSLAIVIAEKQHESKSAVHTFIDNYISSSTEKQEISNALKTLIAVISAAQNAQKAQELLVVDVKNALSVYSERALELRGEGVILQQENELEPDEREAALAAFEKDEKEVLQKISELCAIIMTMCQNCPAPHHHHHDRHRDRHSGQQNVVMKLFHKKKICADLIKTIHCLQLNSKDSLDSVNQILKTLDTLLEGSGSPTAPTANSVPRSIFEMMAGRSAARERREAAGGGIINERDLDSLFGGHDSFAFDGEMRQLLRRLNDENLRAGRAARPVVAVADDDGEGSDTSERERSDSPSEASQNEAEEQPVDGEVRDDAVEANVENGAEDVQMIEAPAGPVDFVEEIEEIPERMEEDLVEEDADDEEEDDNEPEREQQDDDDGDQQDDEEEDEEEEDDEALDVIQVVDPNPEPSGVRRLLVEEDDDDDDDGDEDGDSMEEDVARLDLDDDYFDISGPFAEMHRMDEMLFPPTGFGGRGLAFADMFRDDNLDYFSSYSRPMYRAERRTTPRSGIVSENPLLIRPASDNEPPRRQPTSYRAEILSMSTANRTSLQRQNAIRRTNANDARELEAISRGWRMSDMPSGRVLLRGSEGASAFFDHIFEMRPSNVALNSRMAAYRNYTTGEREERRDVKATQVPGLLDRLDSYMSSMDPISSRFVICIVSSYLTTLHKSKEAQLKKEAEAKAKAKKDADAKKAEEEKKKASEELGLATPAATNTTNTVSETVAPSRSEETGTNTAPTASVASGPEEPMETGEDEPQLPRSTAATAASSVAGAEEMEEVERQVAEEALEREREELLAIPADADDISQHLAEEVDPEPVVVAQEEEAVQEPPQELAAPPAREEMPEEFRAILGDIDIPDGVDPAFLAALPEDMRAEVIRDFQRQQRAERASRPVVAQAAAPAAPAADGAEAPAEALAVPLVEPIDPVFLNALPPELQEEVIAEHERRVREAQDQLNRQNQPAPVHEMDGAAVIASLPMNERAQVLAEMDETELAGLPVEMQNEARRARATHVDPNMARYGRFMFRGAAGVGVGARAAGAAARAAARPLPTGPTVGAQAGNAIQAPTDHPHILDKESIMTLCLLYLVDNNRVPHTRLQKVIRSACVNQMTCDFIVWCLLALLDKASESNTDDEEIVSEVPAWLDSITVSGVGHNERVLRISENAQKVSIHSMLSVPLCKNILELLASIARSYPGNFLPALLRHNAKPTDVVKQAPTFQQFWNMVQNTSKYPKMKDWTAPPEQQLEECPLGQMLNSLEKPTMAKSPLKEKVLKVASQIMVTLPMDTLTSLGIKHEDHKKPLSKKLENVIRVMTTGSCTAEGLADGLTILSEAMRTFDESTSVDIYEHLFSAVTKLGGELLPQIDHLIVELDEAQSQKPEDAAPSDQPSTSKTSQLVVDISAGGRTATGRFDGERLVIDGDQNTRLQMSSCKELQLPAVTVLTDKGGAQYALLSALQTLVKVRNHMKAIRKDKAKRAAEAAKKKAAQEADDAAASTSTAPAPTEAAAPAPADAPVEEAPAPSAAPPTDAAPEAVEDVDTEPRISERLADLENLWESLSKCLLRLGKASDPHAVLALQPAAEAFFLVHASQPHKPKEAKRKESQAGAVASSASHDGLREDLDPDTAKLIAFAEKHRQVLNQALRQNNAVLSAGGPFAILTQFPKLLDFDVKRKFFRKELTKLEPNVPRYRRNDVSLQVSRNRVFSDSFRELFRLRPSEWKNRFYIIFQGEEGQDAGGLLREWFSVITREIFNPDYALFTTAPGDMVTYMINKASYINPEHLEYFKFVGRLIAKSVFEHKYLDCYFTRAFYKHILNLPVKPQDLESEDPEYFNSLEFLLNNQIDGLDLDMTFSAEVEEFGVRSVRDLKPNGRKTEVTDANKEEYVKLVCQMKMTGSIRKQLDAFLTGFYEIIPKDLISMFNEQELELLISGLPTVDIDDMAANTDYKGFQKTSTQIQWFWRALRSFEKEDKAKFLQFVTGTSKVPLQGFAALEGMNGVQKFSIHCDSRGGDRLPAAHTCFNQLDLPQYESYEKLRSSLLLAIRECTEGFGFA